jgi:uncharacterized protein YecE (DUF72 family)
MPRLRGSRWFIGTQGWTYPAWVGPCYPRAARPADYLTLYAKLFDTVEVDSTFYAVPSIAAIQNWVRRTPPSFRFALKFPSVATHDDMLSGRASFETLDVFADRVRPLGTRLGPVLLQFPEAFGPEKRTTLETFLDALPDDLEWSVEFRDRAWFTPAVWGDLAARGIAPALTDSPFVPLDTVLEFAQGPTATFTYVRWLGSREITDYSRVQIDRTKELARWAKALTPILARGIDVFGYFNNHYAGHSPASARAFMEKVGLPVRPPSDLDPQGELFTT